MNEVEGQLMTHLKLGTGRRITESGLCHLGEVDPENFRRLAVLVNYSNFRTNIEFGDISRVLIDQFCRNNTVTGTCFERPTRRQVLGRLRELKVEQFLHLWDEVSLRGDLDFFDYIQSADLYELMYRHRQRMVSPIFGSEIKLTKQQSFFLQSACDSNIKVSRFHLSLPAKISDRLSKSDSQLEELPF
jgi:hypothetical protein